MQFDLKENPELLGAVTWKGKIKDYMKARLKYQPELLKLADNSRVLDNIHREYMALLAKGYKKADIISGSGDFLKWDRQTYTMSRLIADKTNVPNLLVLNFFIAMYNLAKSGKIPFEKWNPKEFEESEKLKKKFSTEKTWLDKTGEKAGKLTRLLMPLSVGAGIITAFFMLRKKG